MCGVVVKWICAYREQMEFSLKREINKEREIQFT